MRRSPWAAWLAFMAVAAGVVASYQSLPPAAEAVCGLGLILASSGAAWFGARRYGGARRGFRLLSVMLLLVAVDAAVMVLMQTEQARSIRITQIAQVGALPSYAFYIWGLVSLRRSQARGSHSWSTALDSWLVAVSAGFVVWQLVVAPSSEGAAPGTLLAVLSGLVLDLAAGYVAIRLALAAYGRNVAATAIALGALLLVPADALFAVDATTGETGMSSGIVATWLASFALIGGAALHPSASAIIRPSRFDVRPATWALVVFVSLGGIPLASALATTVHAPVNAYVNLAVMLVATLILATRVAGLLSVLQRGARQDSLTGLANRAAALDVLDACLSGEHREPLGVLYVDLDGFKHVNDTLGHGVGDLVLTEVARRLERAVRPGEVAARLGGDEFVLILPGIADGLTARRIAARVERALSVPIETGHGQVALGASVGVRIVDGGAEETAESVLHDADRAMYQVKRERRSPGPEAILA